MDGEIKYCVVGIHVGGWELTEPKGNSCNVSMRLDAALEQMKAECWPVWARNKGSKADNQPAALAVQGQLLPYHVRVDLGNKRPGQTPPTPPPFLSA